MGKVEKVVERMKGTKAIRYLSDEVRNRIEEMLDAKEFVEVFNKELGITELTDEDKSEIIEELLEEL